MKTNIIQDLENAVEEFNIVENVIKTFEVKPSIEFKVKFGALQTKKIDCLYRMIVLNNLLKKYFEYSHSFSETLKNEIEHYNSLVGFIKIEDGEIKYSKEFEDIVKHGN